MGAAAVPAAIMGGSSLLGSLLGGGNQRQQFVSYPGAGDVSSALINLFKGGGGASLANLAGLSGGMSPEMRTLNVAFPMLQNMIAGNVPSGLDALTPLFKQNLQTASNKLTATAPGGRFSSGMLQAQGQLGQQATNQFNVLANQMIQEGLNRQLAAASTLGGLSNQAGNAQLDALRALFGGLIGGSTQGTLLTQPSGTQQGMQAGGSLAQLWLLSQMLGGGGAAGGAGGGMGMPNYAGWAPSGGWNINPSPMFGGGVGSAIPPGYPVNPSPGA